MVVKSEKTEWPEQHERERRWFPYKGAATALANRLELLEVLNRIATSSTYLSQISLTYPLNTFPMHNYPQRVSLS